MEGTDWLRVYTIGCGTVAIVLWREHHLAVVSPGKRFCSSRILLFVVTFSTCSCDGQLCAITVDAAVNGRRTAEVVRDLGDVAVAPALIDVHRDRATT